MVCVCFNICQPRMLYAMTEGEELRNRCRRRRRRRPPPVSAHKTLTGSLGQKCPLKRERRAHRVLGVRRSPARRAAGLRHPHPSSLAPSPHVPQEQPAPSQHPHPSTRAPPSPGTRLCPHSSALPAAKPRAVDAGRWGGTGGKAAAAPGRGGPLPPPSSPPPGSIPHGRGLPRNCAEVPARRAALF